MNKSLTIAWREYVETVKTRTFLLSSLFMPLFILALVFGTEWLMRVTLQETLPVRVIGLRDATGALESELRVQIEAHNEQQPNRPYDLRLLPPETTKEAADAEVASQALFAWIDVPAAALDLIAGEAGAISVTRGDQQIEVGRQLQGFVTAALVMTRFRAADPPVDVGRITAMQAPPTFRSFDVSSGKETTGQELVQLMTPFVFMFLLFIATINISQGLLTSVIEEKNSRIVELLLSAVSPTQLMAGKILGMVGVGATLLVVWGALGYFGTRSQELRDLVDTSKLFYLALYFVPGFFLTSAFLAGVGAACNTLKEAQGMAFPFTLMSAVPVMFWLAITNSPNSALAVSLSFVPPMTPFVMILRLCAKGTIPLWQVVATLTLLWLSVAGMVILAGKIFRVGVLMYGKAPTVRELFRWLRYA